MGPHGFNSHAHKPQPSGQAVFLMSSKIRGERNDWDCYGSGLSLQA